MEEVDGIIIYSLKQLGLKLPDSVTNVSQFDSNTMLQACSLCFQLLNYSAELPTRMPPEIGQKYSVCTTIANALQELGYTGEIGYDTVLYPNERSTRKLFRWLLEQLPRAESGPETAAAVATSDVFHRDLLNAVAAAAQQPFIAPAYRSPPVRRGFAPALLGPLTRSAAAAALDRARADFFHAEGSQGAAAEAAALQKRRERIQRAVQGALRSALAAAGAPPPPFVRRSGRGLSAGDGEPASVFAQQVDSAMKEQPAAPVVDEKEWVAIEAELQARVTALQDESTALDKAMANLALAQKQLAARQESQGAALAQLRQEHGLKAQVHAMVGTLDESLARLRQISAASAQRLLELGREWEQHRLPLVEEYRRARSDVAAFEAELAALLEKRERVREELRNTIAAAREKEQRIAQLQAELERLPRDVNRAVYTRRILEIIKNVKKQQVDIDKILIDIHQVRKEINSINDALGRAFAATDELVYQEARKGDEVVKQIYRQIIEMNDSFQKLVRVVEETGATLNNSRELEQQIDHLAARSNDLNTERVLQDLAQIKAEQAAQAKTTGGR